MFQCVRDYLNMPFAKALLTLITHTYYRHTMFAAENLPFSFWRKLIWVRLLFTHPQ
jgi:hypothetical protein